MPVNVTRFTTWSLEVRTTALGILLNTPLASIQKFPTTPSGWAWQECMWKCFINCRVLNKCERQLTVIITDNTQEKSELSHQQSGFLESSGFKTHTAAHLALWRLSGLVPQYHCQCFSGMLCTLSLVSFPRMFMLTPITLPVNICQVLSPAELAFRALCRWTFTPYQSLWGGAIII